jgi:hypothetical protein
MQIETWIRQDDGTVDVQDEWSLPQQFSWLNHAVCHGAEVMTTKQY